MINRPEGQKVGDAMTNIDDDGDDDNETAAPAPAGATNPAACDALAHLHLTARVQGRHPGKATMYSLTDGEFADLADELVAELAAAPGCPDARARLHFVEAYRRSVWHVRNPPK